MARRQTRPPLPTNSMSRQVCDYVRVSTAGQVEDGVSLEAQRAKIPAWCAMNDYTLGGIYADAGVSGYRFTNRPALQRALEAVCSCGGILVASSLSRFARNTKETLELGERLAKAHADLVSLSEKIDTTSAAGKMVFRMLAVFSEFERDQIAERTTMALSHKKAQGERVGEIPYGYMVGGDGKTLVPNTSEQAVLATIRQYRAAGLSLRAVVTAAARDGLCSRVGKPFQLTQVAHMLHGA